tara:strand:- start:47 stop:403 length:357 start_codon:yes stop_codon:yes gene_type:complete
MSHSHKITINQVLINKINAKQDFSYSLNNDTKRYIVGDKNLFSGKNPSIQYDLIYNDILELDNSYSTIGGWTDPKTNIYYVDYSLSFDSVFDALEVARENKEIAIYDTLENKAITLIK